MITWVGTAVHTSKRFIFLDRDGVVNEDSPYYIKRWMEYRFYPDALEALRWLKEREIGAILISNQSALNRGIATWPDFWELHENMIQGIREAGGDLLATFYCPHHPDEGCACRKPLPGMLRAAEKLFGIPLGDTPFVGDKRSDLLAANSAGCVGVKLDRLDGAIEPYELTTSWPFRFESLLDAVSTLECSTAVWRG